MNVCVTSEGTDLDSPVDPRFGRARYFILYDDESGEFQTVDNAQNLNAASGAGVQAATNVGETGAEHVVTGHIGPRALKALQAAGIQVYVGAEGTVQEAIDAFLAGELEAADRADVSPHW